MVKYMSSLKKLKRSYALSKNKTKANESINNSDVFDFENDDFPIADPNDDDNDYWEGLYQKMYGSEDI